MGTKLNYFFIIKILVLFVVMSYHSEIFQNLLGFLTPFKKLYKLVNRAILLFSDL